MTIKIYPGKRFTRLTVINEAVPVDRNKRWKCLCDCGNIHEVSAPNLRSGNVHSCGCLRKEKDLARRKEKIITATGYVLVRQPDHPRASKKTGRIREHILVMEKILGRHLLPGEEVHHKNGVRSDNDPENLELWVVSQPRGQRPQDLVEWAKEILKKYEKLTG